MEDTDVPTCFSAWLTALCPDLVSDSRQHVGTFGHSSMQHPRRHVVKTWYPDDVRNDIRAPCGSAALGVEVRHGPGGSTVTARSHAASWKTTTFAARIAEHLVWHLISIPPHSCSPAQRLTHSTRQLRNLLPEAPGGPKFGFRVGW
jgi:hypothetical protein